MFLKLASLIAFGALAAMPHDPLPDLKIGTPLPASDVRMKDVSGKETTLKDAAGRNGLLVVFTCNTCPFVVGTEDSEGWEGRYAALAAFAERRAVGVAFINSNTAKRDAGDGLADMQARYEEKKYAGHYLLDENNQVADAFGARTTPHVFLFDQKHELAYKGAIDDNVTKAAGVKERYLEQAITNVAGGRPAEPAITRNIGCSIKRVAVPHQH